MDIVMTKLNNKIRPYMPYHSITKSQGFGYAIVVLLYTMVAIYSYYYSTYYYAQ